MRRRGRGSDPREATPRGVGHTLMHQDHDAMRQCVHETLHAPALRRGQRTRREQRKKVALPFPAEEERIADEGVAGRGEAEREPILLVGEVGAEDGGEGPAQAEAFHHDERA